MINKAIIEAVIKQAKSDNKDMILSAFINALAKKDSYNDDKVNHCLELLLNATKLINPNDVNIDYIKYNFDKYVYKYNEYIIKDIEINYIDNIEGSIYIKYKCKEKINEDRDDIDFYTYNVCINFIDNPEILNNVK